MTNFSHWAYWTQSKETCSFQALGAQWYLKVGRSKLVILDEEGLWGGNCGEKNEQENWGIFVNFPGLLVGQDSSVLCLSGEHILINLSRHHFPPQWQKPSQNNYFHIKGWVRMAPVPLFLILFYEKCNAEMINCQADPILFLLVIELNQNAQI